jgi:hypothetical protein
MVVPKDEIVNLLPGAGDELGLRSGLGQGLEEFERCREDTSFDDIDVGRYLHRGSKLWRGWSAGKPLMGSGRVNAEDGIVVGAKIKRAGYP